MISEHDKPIPSETMPTPTILETFSAWLRNTRASRGLTQRGLAELLGIQQGYLSRLEKGETFPSAPMLDQMLDALQMSVPEFCRSLENAARLPSAEPARRGRPPKK